MKKTLSLILAALMLASTMTACGNTAGKTEPKETEKYETQAVETNAPDINPPSTDISETGPVETEAPAPVYPYDTSLITENGVAKAHIVLPGTSDFEKLAADELQYHIKLVSGAEVSITDTAAEDSLPIIIATPDSLPELETLFPEDIAWLHTTKETTEAGTVKRWGGDGFAVRQKDGKLYIFGATAEGAMNGVYDFIEDNMGVLWLRTDEAGIVFDPMPTITAVKTDYREKSPFDMRYNFGNPTLARRNKHNTATQVVDSCHNVKRLLLTSPTYDPNINEYWDTDTDGNHLTAGQSKQVNYWSELTADTIADSVIAILGNYDDASRPKYYSVGMEDIYSACVYPEMTEPFEYAPGQFVEPTNAAYFSTVYFSFISRVAARVAEKYPETNIMTLSYFDSIYPPLGEMNDHVSIWFCPYNEDYTQPDFSVALAEAEEGTSTSLATIEAKCYADWQTMHPNTDDLIFDYYFCHYVGGWYERPIWDRFQKDYQYYAESGSLGTFSCFAYTDTSSEIYTWTRYSRTNEDDFPYKFTHADAHSMNHLSQWLFCKLTWNPYEDVDALIKYFCDKVYGDASDEMQEYYDLLEKGWNYGSTELLPYEFNAKINLSCDQQYYFDYFLDVEVDGVYIIEAITDALNRAWEAADDKAKEFIRRPYEVFQDWEQFLE